MKALETSPEHGTLSAMDEAEKIGERAVTQPVEIELRTVPLEFEIPANAVQNGELTLTWFCEPGLGGNVRGCKVSEVWLLKR